MPRDSELGRVKAAIERAGLVGVTVQELVSGLGLSESCVRRHLSSLLAKDWAEEDAIEPKSVGRPTKLYRKKR